MLIAEEIELTELKNKVGEVNAQNEIVELAVNSFNDATVKVNVMKDDVFSSLQKENNEAITRREVSSSAFFVDFIE